ncbi:YhgE/Pip domain-containing protein [Saccharibacillus alkalitolerans]|uniref:YhgE/Pip domain-containing protein n=1 Tax=Saccharibacillus alkalitolerans TaxID=2705290 RepID=A0ABX0F5K8_9BACL|nr:YhgE/Pip domain-containing protein [Saccharibacillus alkalitolerans]NGZ74834.1 YhgE/Pip domain-containing protein [Saccharibacillus alkalitolerans]
MKSLGVFFSDLKTHLKNPKILIPIVVVLFIPVLYSGLFLTAFWDPYGKMDEIPVAVVNLDQGAQYDGETLQAGQDLIDELKKDGSFDWQFVDADTAARGLEDETYYMRITVPADFSRKATTVLDKQPQTAEIEFSPNKGYNFLAGQIGETAMKEIKGKVSEAVTKTYTEKLFAKLDTISEGFGDAGEGAGKLKDGAGDLGSGAGELKDGASQLKDGLVQAGDGAVALKEGAGKLQNGTLQLQNGAATLQENLDKLAAGAVSLQSGQSKLQNGAAQLKTGAGSLQTGAGKLAGGLGQLSDAHGKIEAGAAGLTEGAVQLQAGIGQAAGGVGSLRDALKQSAAGSAQLKDGLAASSQASQQLNAGAQGVADGLEHLLQASPQLAQSPDAQKLLAAAQAVAAGSGELSAGQAKLSEGAAKLDGAQQQMLSGAEQLAAGGTKLQTGADSLIAGQKQLGEGLKQFGAKLDEAAAGGRTLSAGAGQLASGSAQLEAGLGQASAGAGELASGARQLSAGAGKLGSGAGELASGAAQLGAGTDTLASGAVKLRDGAGKLEDGAGQLQDGAGRLADGSGELQSKLSEAAAETADVNKGDANAQMYAAPVELNETVYHDVPNYGTGFAPYFLSLGLFVGALISTLVVPLRGSSVAETTGWNRFVSRFLSFFGMSLLQSALAVVVTLFVLKMDVQSVPLFCLFTWVASFSFTMMIQAFVTWLDNPGRFMMLLLLIFQLTTSAGTFPLELIPNWMKAFNPWMPMTHTVIGYKAAISTGAADVVWHQTILMGAIGVAFLLLTLFYFLRERDVRQPETSANPAPAGAHA